MSELCLMASHGFHPSEYLPGRLLKDSQHFLPNFAFNHDTHKLSFGRRMHQIELHPKNGMYDYKISSAHSNLRRSLFIDFQDFPPSLMLKLTAKPYVTHEGPLRFFLSRSSDEEKGAVDLSKLFYLVGPQAAGLHMPQQPLPPYYQQLLFDAKWQPSLISPIMELSSEGPVSSGDLRYSSLNHLSEGQLLVASSCLEMKYIPGTISEVYSLNNTMNWKKQAMLVPYFDRRISKATKTSSPALASDIEPMKSSAKLKQKRSLKKKSNEKGSKERDHHRSNYLHECESLLSLMVDKKLHGTTLINFLKRSSPEIPKLLTQFSASIAGTGLAVVFSIVCKVVYDRVPFGTSKLLSTGLGFGLVWLSWAVNKLGDTVISISKNPGKLGVGDKEMVSNLDRNVREIYFRAVTIVAIAFLRFA